MPGLLVLRALPMGELDKIVLWWLPLFLSPLFYIFIGMIIDLIIKNKNSNQIKN
jgi:hypothetical protein